MMSAGFRQTSDPRRDDPLDELQARIAEARRSAATAAEAVSVPEAADPLERLDQQLARARSAESLAEPPLGQLYVLIRRARDLAAPLEGYPEAAAEQNEPLERLRTAVAGEIEAIGGYSTIDLPRPAADATRPTTDQPTTSRAPADTEAAVGREVLALLDERPLAGSSRTEAVRRLADLSARPGLDDGVRAELRDILEILLFE
jgi:hypothetical protein